MRIHSSENGREYVVEVLMMLPDEWEQPSLQIFVDEDLELIATDV